MKTTRYGVALTAACAALLLSGCGGGGGEASTAGGRPEQAAPAMAPTPAPSAAADESRAADGKSITSDVKVVQQNRSIVYVASMTVRTKDVTASAEKAKTIVTGAGGYLSNEKSSSPDSGSAIATLEFKVPPDRYPAVLTSLGKDLGKRENLTQGTQDVTQQVADVDSRLKSAQRELETLRSIMTKAKTIGQVLEVEREISSRQAELESLQAQQKELARQVGMATLTLELVGPEVVVAEPDDDPPGFMGGLKAGWEALLTFLKVAVTVVGAVLPWMLIVAPVVALIIFVVRRSSRPAGPPPQHSGPRPTEPPPPPTQEDERSGVAG
ncbi:DUF4349 domain-containing protein [Nonomuraea sp. NPDC050556]|uniref:DUF4349 domain-containing protein n=1 Tax=Nonomuraea sp. NPDC050556 TaxID=3364369 RepID=UPI00378DD732